jgi:hypothetical protein
MMWKWFVVEVEVEVEVDDKDEDDVGMWILDLWICGSCGCG